jgi:hypothetical protein
MSLLFLDFAPIMKLCVHTLRGVTASIVLPAGLLHTLFVFCATSLMIVIAILAFLLALLLRFTVPTQTSRRGGRHVAFDLEPKIAIMQSYPDSAPSTPTLSLTATPRELEPQTPDVAEDPLRALSRICGFLASNTARAWKGDKLGTTPPLAGLEPYLDAVRVDLARIDEMEVERGQEQQEEEQEEEQQEEQQSAEGSDRKDEDEVPGAGLDAGVDAHDEPGLVHPHQATHADPLLPPPSQFPTPPSPLPTHESASASTATAAPSTTPAPSTDSKYAPQRRNTLTLTTTTAIISPAQAPTTTTTTTTAATVTANPRKRKDAVLRPVHPITDPEHADADADDATVRAAALLSRFADLGAGLEGTMRERGGALWTALSGRRTPPEIPVPPLPQTRPSSSSSSAVAAALIAAPRDVNVVEASRVVAHQAAWRARFASYGRLLGPAAEQK